MSKALLACFAILLLLAAGFVLLSLSHQAAAQGVPRNCANNLNDDTPDDAVVNDGCPKVGSLTENLVCVNAIDDDGDTNVNDGCPRVGSNPENPACVNDSRR